MNKMMHCGGKCRLAAQDSFFYGDLKGHGKSLEGAFANG
jgi:hypothetical protein